MEKDIKVFKRQYDRMRDELEQANSRHGLELAKVEAVYQERIARLKRDEAAYKDAGLRYEAEIAKKDAAIAAQAKQLKDAVAELERVMRERDAAVRDVRRLGWCAVCAENGGTEE